MPELYPVILCPVNYHNNLRYSIALYLPNLCCNLGMPLFLRRRSYCPSDRMIVTARSCDSTATCAGVVDVHRIISSTEAASDMPEPYRINYSLTLPNRNLPKIALVVVNG